MAGRVGNVLVVAARRGRIGPDDRPVVRTSLEALQIEIDPVSTSRVWGPALELANAYGISAHDAIYLELAVRLRFPLATLDQASGTAGRAEGLDLPALP